VLQNAKYVLADKIRDSISVEHYVPAMIALEISGEDEKKVLTTET